MSLDSDEAVVHLVLSLINYSDFNGSLGVLRLVNILKPSLIPVMMRQIPHPELLRSSTPVLQNILIRIDDESLARFIGAAGEKISLRLMENISSNRQGRISKLVVQWRYVLHEGDLKSEHKLIYYLSYLFIYEQVKDFL